MGTVRVRPRGSPLESGHIIDVKFVDFVVVQFCRDREYESTLTNGVLVDFIEKDATLFRPWLTRSGAIPRSLFLQRSEQLL